jgi:hypothetical protein
LTDLRDQEETGSTTASREMVTWATSEQMPRKGTAHGTEQNLETQRIH